MNPVSVTPWCPWPTAAAAGGMKLPYGDSPTGYVVRADDWAIVFPEWSASKLADPLSEADDKEEGELIHADIDEDRMLHFFIPPHSKAILPTRESVAVSGACFVTIHATKPYADLGLVVTSAPLYEKLPTQYNLKITVVNPTVSSIKVYVDSGIALLKSHPHL